MKWCVSFLAYDVSGNTFILMAAKENRPYIEDTEFKFHIWEQ